MQIQCPGCGSQYRIKTEGTGRSSGRVRCPKCARVFEVDLNAETSTRPTAPVQAPRAGKEAAPVGG